MADRLALIPATAKRAEGVAFEVRLDRGAASAGEMINVDLKVRRQLVGKGWSCLDWVIGYEVVGWCQWVDLKVDALVMECAWLSEREVLGLGKSVRLVTQGRQQRLPVAAARRAALMMPPIIPNPVNPTLPTSHRVQGIVKPALQRLRDAYAAKARELGDQLLSLQVSMLAA